MVYENQVLTFAEIVKLGWGRGKKEKRRGREEREREDRGREGESKGGEERREGV